MSRPRAAASPSGDTLELEGPNGMESINLRPRFHANNGDTCRAAALAGHGVILQPTFLVRDDINAGRLVELLPEYRSLELGIYAVYPTRKHVLPKVRALIDFLAERFAQSAGLW